MNNLTIRVMNAKDYDEVLAFLAGAEGFYPGPAETRELFIRFLQRNPALSLVAVENETIVGCIFCGHDGWQGFLYLPVVSTRYREAARSLLDQSLDALVWEDITQVRIEIQDPDDSAQEFWSLEGWGESVSEPEHRYDLATPVVTNTGRTYHRRW